MPQTAADYEELWPSDSDSDDEEISNSILTQDILIPIKQFFLFSLFFQFAYNISNSAICCLLLFLKFFIYALGSAFQCESLVEAVHRIPVGIKTIHKLLGTHGDDFIKYVVCPKCDSVYTFADCCEKRSNGVSISRICQHVSFPNHPQLSQRTPCNTLLLKKVRTKYGISLQPYKVYPYRSLQTSLSILARSPNFLKQCELWRKRSFFNDSSHLGDIYDGEVWKHFISSDFLKSPFCYMVTLNVDWFQRFERDVYSVGAIIISYNTEFTKRHSI